MEIHFILVRPARAENIGFSARALKTMGFGSLRLVGSQGHLQPEARKTGYASHDVLDGANDYEDLPSALKDLDLTVGTTSKHRIKRYDYHEPAALANLIFNKAPALKQLGLVFGSEENGLSTDELDLCDLVSTIPLDTEYPSLNLAQSVLIYAWELSKLKQPAPPLPSLSNDSLQLIVKQESQRVLDWLEFDQKPLLKRRIMDRILTANAPDMELMITLLKKLQRKQ